MATTRTKARENQPRSLFVSFALGSIATSGACIGSNPFEVVKTRMQLMGELSSSSTAAPPRYRNAFHAFYTICRTEGIRGIQRGLLPGMCYQAFMNGTRLGLFEPLQQSFGALDPATTPYYTLRNIAAGATSGAIGAIVGSPFFLIKARIQAAGGTTSVNTASEYKYRGMIDGFRSVLSKEGPSGLYRGVTGAMPRVAVGSSAQLASYSSAKHLVLSSPFFEDNVVAHVAASMVSGVVVTTAMNPFDVVSTRLYSQKVVNGKGVLYDGVLDAFRKIVRTEGPRGLLKGWTAHYFRLGPHTILTFVLWEKVKKMATNYGY